MRSCCHFIRLFWSIFNGLGLHPKITYPHRAGTGWDLAGTVVAVGSACARLKPGDRVWADIAPTFGAFAEFVVAEEAQLGIAPSSVV